MATDPLAPATIGNLLIRIARRDDLPSIVALLADDNLGAAREDMTLPLNAAYERAFESISRDSSQTLLVAEIDDAVVGTLQITIIPGLSHRGSLRGQIEAVRVRSDHRGQGIGALLIAHAIACCKQRSCRIVELTTNNTRTGAHRFYERLGFSQSHKGFKLKLEVDQS